MNNMNCNYPIRYGLNNINSFEFNQTGQTFPNSHIPVKLNSNGNHRSNSNLIRPIPKKLDLSHMIYHQTVDPRSKQTPSNLFNGNEIVSQNLFSKIYSNPISNSISRNFHNNTGIRQPDISHSIPNSHSPFSDHRLTFNQYYSSNQSPIENLMYSSGTGVPGQRLSNCMGAVDSFTFNRNQLPMRNNCINEETYMSINNPKEIPLTTALYEEVESITTTQLYPKMSFSDDLIESHFSMSLNSHRKFNFKNKESLPATTKQERTTKKSSKQQIKYVEKSNKLLKRVKKTKGILNCLDPMKQTVGRPIAHETSEILCATPNDSSISPSSMVSCRSTITPHAVTYNTNNLALISQNPHTNHQSSILITDQLESSLNVQNISDIHRTHIHKSQKNIKGTADFLVQGLPIKKRIKWQNEDQEKEQKSEFFKNVTRTVTNSKLDRGQSKLTIGESVNENTEKADKGIFTTISEDPLRTVPKTFLPMEKPIDLTDSDSENDAWNNDYTNHYSNKNHPGIFFMDNNI